MAKAIARGRCIFMLYLSKVERNKQIRREGLEPSFQPIRAATSVSRTAVVGLSGVIAKATPHSYWCYPGSHQISRADSPATERIGQDSHLLGRISRSAQNR